MRRRGSSVVIHVFHKILRFGMPNTERCWGLTVFHQLQENRLILIFLGMASELEERLQVPVLDAAALSVGMAELLVRQNIHSSRRAYPAWRRNSDN